MGCNQIKAMSGVLFLLLAALLVGALAMIWTDINGMIGNGQVLREDLSTSSRIALRLFQDESMATTDEVDVDQLMISFSGISRYCLVAALLSAGYGIFLLLRSGQKNSNGGPSN